jgi:hypothetical protein
MKRALISLLPAILAVNLHAFDLQSVHASRLAFSPAAVNIHAPVPLPYRALSGKAAGAKFAVQQVNGIAVAVPSIGCGFNLLAAVKPRETSMAENVLRQAFYAPAAARLQAIQPSSSAELEFAAQNPGAGIYSVNQFLPANAAALFNREPNFGGPNCFNAAFTAAGMMQPDKLRHVGNHEADQLFSMYYKKTSASDLRPGDIVVLNGGDHSVFYLGAGLVFHKKSYLKNHIYRVVPLESAYKPEPFEWTPSPFDGGMFTGDVPITRREAWHPTGVQHPFGPATAAEQAKVEIIVFLTDHIAYQAPRWTDLAGSRNPVLKAYYHKLESLRDQANQSIEVELLSSQHAQSNATEILKGVWFPRNDYSRSLIQQLMNIYGRNPADLDKIMAAVEKDFDGSPLRHIKGN